MPIRVREEEEERREGKGRVETGRGEGSLSSKQVTDIILVCESNTED